MENTIGTQGTIVGTVTPQSTATGGVVNSAGSVPINSSTTDPNRNDKGQFVPGNTASLGNEGGRPCRLCENMQEYLDITRKYIEECQNPSKPKVPFLEEIALKLKTHRKTVSEWVENKADHPEFCDLIYTVQTVQSLRLQQRVLGRYNPTGAISLLKWHHGMIETEKKILAGDKNEPVKLEVEIIEEKKTIDEDE